MPEDKRLKAEIIRANAETVGELTSTETALSSDNNYKFQTKINVSRILREHVGEIKNCEVKDADTGEVKFIKNGKELAESTAFEIKELVDALCLEVIRKTLPDELKKK
jgi:hypothetical protein